MHQPRAQPRNHTRHVFSSYPESRRLNNEQVAFVRPLIEINVRPSLIAERLQTATGKVIIARDLQNLKNSKRAGEAQELLEFISQLREMENARVVVTADDNSDLEILLVQTKEMQRMFEGYSEVLLLDATYRTISIRCLCLYS